MVMRTVRGLIEKTEISTGVEGKGIGVSEPEARAGLIKAMAPAEMTALRASLRLNWSFIDEHLLLVEIYPDFESAISAGWIQGGVPVVSRVFSQGASTAKWRTVSGQKD
jgi:hypothetical protein